MEFMDVFKGMVAGRIITSVQEPTECLLSQMMVVGKPDGDVRICLDPSELKQAVQRHHSQCRQSNNFLVSSVRKDISAALMLRRVFIKFPLSYAAS